MNKFTNSVQLSAIESIQSMYLQNKSQNRYSTQRVSKAQNNESWRAIQNTRHTDIINCYWNVINRNNPQILPYCKMDMGTELKVISVSYLEWPKKMTKNGTFETTQFCV